MDRATLCRQRTLHNDRGVHLCDRVVLNAKACHEALRDEGLDDIARLALLIAAASGDTTMSLAELKAVFHDEVIEAGGVGAAIRHREIILR